MQLKEDLYKYIMNIIFLLIGFSGLIALMFLVAFFWANRTKQYDDTYTPSVRILFDEDIHDSVENDGHSSNKS